MSNLKSVALTVLELLAFNSHDRPLRTDNHTQTDRHTSNEHIISAIHFVHLAEIIINTSYYIYLTPGCRHGSLEKRRRTLIVTIRVWFSLTSYQRCREEQLKPISQLRFDCDTTTTRLRRKIDMLIFCSRRIASNGSRRAQYVVVGS